MKPNLFLFAISCFLGLFSANAHAQQAWSEAMRYASPSSTLLDNTSTALGADGSTYVLGNFRNQAVFDTVLVNAPVPNRTFGYLLKLDPFMKPLWAVPFPQKPYYVSVDAQGQIWIAGSLRRLNTDDADSLAYAAKYTTNGTLLAQFTAGGSAESWAKVVRTDAMGNCYLAGERLSTGNTSFGNTAMPSVSSRECFLVKLTPNLSQVLWAKYTGASSNLDNVYDLDIDDANGYVYASGNYSQNYSPPIFGCGCYNGDFFVEKHDAQTGNSVWKKIFSGGSGSDTKQFVRLSPDGQTLSVAACFKKTTLFEPTISLTANPNDQYDYHLFLAQLNATTATVQWAKKISTTGDSYLWRMARQADDVWLFGFFAKPTDIGPYSLTNSNIDAFLAKTSALDGAIVEAEKLAGNKVDRGFGLAVQDTMVVVSGTSASASLAIGSFNLTGNDYSIFVARKGGALLLPPVADFVVDTATSGCAPLVLHFSSTATQSPTSFQWIFPGGSPATSMEANPMVVYGAPGVYPVTLIVQNGAGADTLVQSDFVHVLGANPTAAFSSATNNLEVSFSNLSIDATSYLWDFGDGQTSNAISPAHTYAQCGTYTVTLTCTGICGTASSTSGITIGNGLPTALFVSNVAGLNATFDNLSVNASAYFWDFGDGTTSTETNPVHVYADCDNYVVTLVCTNACGTASSTLLVHASEMPEALFSIEVDSLQVSVTNNSTSGASYFWDFGDGYSSSLQSPPPHTYANVGTYVITLVVTNQCGANILQQTATLLPCPTAAFEVSTNGLTASFHNLSTLGTSFMWDFGDGQSSTEENPEHTYANAGMYGVTLTVSNECGAQAYSKIVTLESVGVESPEWLDAFRIFPNPSQGLFALQIEADWTGDIAIDMVNTSGQSVFKETIGPIGASFTHSLDCSDLPSGVYWLRMGTKEGWLAKKIVIAR